MVPNNHFSRAEMQCTCSFVCVKCWQRGQDNKQFIPLVVRPGNEQRKSSSICWIWRFWTVSSCCLPVVQNCHIETFVLPLHAKCWNVSLPPPPLGRPPALSFILFHLEEANRHHWPNSFAKRMNCRICSAHRNRRSIHTKCEECDFALCILRCFKEYHTVLDDTGEKPVHTWTR
jgi:hypothetical protein